MVDINLEKIKALTKVPLSKYYNLRNQYSWEEVYDTSNDKRLLDVPLYNRSKDTEMYLRRVYSSGQKSYVCFGLFTVQYARQSTKNRILFRITPNRKLLNSTTNNHCWMNINQLNYWIQTMKEDSGLDFFYRIRQDDTKYIIDYDFKSLNRLQMKYILFWTRYTYEYPASFLALGAMILKRDYYPEETLQNLLTLVSDCQRINAVPLTPYQCITNKGNFITLEAFREKINSRNRRSVTSIFGTIPGSMSKLCGMQLKDFYCVDNITGSSWIDNTSRFNIYTEAYPILKSREIKVENENKEVAAV